MGKPPARSRLTRERDAKTVAFAEAKDKKSKKGAAAPAPDADGAPDKAAESTAETSEASETSATATTTATTTTTTTTTTTATIETTEPPAAAPERPTPTQDATTMPMEVIVGGPPDLPVGTVEEPTHMPHPRDVPSGSPDDAAPAPGRVPPGDSRSLRNGAEFALIYRIGTFVITRTGAVGKRGQWRVVEYPTSAAASHAYAKASSRFVSEGFSDYRD